MSFGQGLRLQTQTGENGKVKIFWEQGNSGAQSKKKFSYKKKSQPFPLRSKVQQEEPANDLTVTKAAPRQPTQEHNNRTVIDQKQPEKKSIKISNGISKASGKTDSKPTEGQKSKIMSQRPKVKSNNKVGAGTITLTQDQLNAILETIGKTNSSDSAPVRISIDQDTHDIRIEGDTDEGSKDVQSESANHDKKSTDNKDLSSEKPNTHEEDQSPSGGNTERDIMALLRKNKSTEESEERDNTGNNNYMDTEKTRETQSKQKTAKTEKETKNKSEKAEKKDAKNESKPSDNTDSNPTVSPRLPIVKGHMTKAEIKRLQWEIERNENEKLYKQSHGQFKKVESQQNHSSVVHNDEGRVPPKEAVSGVPVLSKTEIKKAQWNRERNENEKMQNQMRHSQEILERQPDRHSVLAGGQTDGEIHNFTASVQRAPLSKIELKRLQWEKEKAELEKVNKVAVDPWGRPGAGAPVRTDSGKILTDYSSRLLPSLHPELTDLTIPVNDSESVFSLSDDEQVLRTSLEKNKKTDSAVTYTVNGAPLHPDTAATYTIKNEPSPRQDMSTVPAAMRSHFMLGGVASNDFGTTTKEEERKKWLQDLEKQREEKRLLKERNKQEGQSQETWADQLGQHKPAELAKQSNVTRDDIVMSGQDTARDNRISSAPMAVEVDSSSAAEMTHARGQNLNLNPHTQRELEEQRKRHLEHQKAIQAQVEEKQRLKREETERKAREEAEEEKKLAKERELLQLQYQLEQEKAKKKEQREEQRIQALKEAMDRAKEDAAREKMEKRLRKLKDGGHDTRQLKTNMEGELSPRSRGPVQPIFNNTVEPSVMIPGLELSPRVTQTVLVSARETVAPPIHEPYTENRVLTPSQYRQGVLVGPNSPMREFGTQTDLKAVFDFTNMKKDSVEETQIDIEFKGKLKKKKETKKVRVESAVMQKEEKQSEKLKWGYQNKKGKTATKQSERDPYYQKRKQQREKQKNQRMVELKALADANATKNPTRTKSRIVERASTKTPANTDAPPSHREDNQEVNILNLLTGGQESHRGNTTNRSERSHIQSTTVMTDRYSKQERSHSPPVPTLRNKAADQPSPRQQEIKQISPRRTNFSNDYSMQQYNYDQHARTGQTREAQSRANQQSVISHMEGEFMPFLRSEDILDPVHAESPVPVSRENSAQERARVAYLQNLQPGNYGTRLENYEDSHYAQMIPERKHKDPIFNPHLVTDHPTPRQDVILQQLSEMRKGLLQKQREIESCLSPSELTASRIIHSEHDVDDAYY